MNAANVPDSRRSQVASHEIRSEAINFLKGHKAKIAQKDVPEFIPLRTTDAMQKHLLLHPRYRSQSDTVALAAEAKAYIKDRFPIASREVAIAVLLSRDARESLMTRFNLSPMEPQPLEEPEEWTVEVEDEHSHSPASLPTVSGRKFR